MRRVRLAAAAFALAGAVWILASRGPRGPLGATAGCT